LTPTLIWQLEVLKSAYYIKSFWMVLYDIFSDMKCMNHFTNIIDFDFHCCFGLDKKSRQVSDKMARPSPLACDCSWQILNHLRLMPLEN